jgi:hypothetical protein
MPEVCTFVEIQVRRSIGRFIHWPGQRRNRYCSIAKTGKKRIVYVDDHRSNRRCWSGRCWWGGKNPAPKGLLMFDDDDLFCSTKIKNHVFSSCNKNI